MLVKVNSVNQVSEILSIENKKENEFLTVLKSILLIIFCSVLAPTVFLFYQLANAQPKSHFGVNMKTNAYEQIVRFEAKQHQCIPSNLNIGKVEMGPFLVPICNILNESAENPAYTKIDPMDVNAQELFSMVETKK